MGTPVKLARGSEEFFQEVGCGGGAVFGCAADVVYGFGFVDQGGAGLGDCFVGDGLVDEGLLGGVEAGGDFSQTGGGNSDVFDGVVAYACNCSEGYFRDRLCVAGAYFADIGFVTTEVT